MIHPPSNPIQYDYVKVKECFSAGGVGVLILWTEDFPWLDMLCKSVDSKSAVAEL